MYLVFFNLHELQNSGEFYVDKLNDINWKFLCKNLPDIGAIIYCMCLLLMENDVALKMPCLDVSDHGSYLLHLREEYCNHPA